MKIMSESEYDQCVDIIIDFDKYLDTWGTCMMINDQVWKPSDLLRITDPIRYIATMLTWIASEDDERFKRIERIRKFRATRQGRISVVKNKGTFKKVVN